MRLLKIFFALMTLPALSQPGTAARPFSLDDETLLLANFEDDAYRADYANGWDEFAGNGAPIVEGYFGKAVDLTSLAPAAPGEGADRGIMPYFSQWAFWPKGNVRYAEGTFEFWFRAALDRKRPPRFGNSALFFYHFQPLRPRLRGAPEDPAIPDEAELYDKALKELKIEHIHPFLRLDESRISYLFVTLKGGILHGTVDFEQVPGFNRKLNPEDWHHFAMTWCDGEFAVYLDGRKLASHDIRGQHGISIASAANRPVAMSGIVLDALRISAVVRYRGDFQPAWIEGRPDYAFTGVPGLRPVPSRYSPPVIPAAEEPREKSPPVVWVRSGLRFHFDPKDGSLRRLVLDENESSELREGLHLYRGIGRERLEPGTAAEITRTGENLRIDQRYEDALSVTHELSPGEAESVRWKVTIRNESDTAQALEVLLGLPVPFERTDSYYDGSWRQTLLGNPRRRDEYPLTQPFTAISDGTGASLGFGFNPAQNVSSLISEWVPEGAFRQGFRVVLSPGEIWESDYRVVSGSGRFGTDDALERFQNLFPELFQLDPAVPVQSYMAVCQHFDYVHQPDMGRRLYIGNQWGHGPTHTKGDPLGTEKYWKNPDLDGKASYRHAQRHQKLYHSVENLRKETVAMSKRSFDYYYSLRRSHDVPNLTATFIVEDLWPGFDERDDPLIAGQYYLPNMLMVNEFNTVLGKKFSKDQIALMELIGRYSPGLINDMCMTSPYRFVDEMAQKSAGRAFSADRGEYLVGDFGHVQRYQAINKFTLDGYRQSIWSDGGMVSYALAAHSSAVAKEAGERFWGFTAEGGSLQASRDMLGEKPLVLLVSYGEDDLGTLFDPSDFTPAQLREHYRGILRGIMLFAIRRGVYLDPPYLHGHQWMVEHNPLLVESVVRGRKTTPGATVEAPLWIVRGGRGWDTLWIAANETGEEVSAIPRFYSDSFDGWSPVVVDYFGKTLTQQISPGETEVHGFSLHEKSLAGFKPAGRIRSDKPVRMTAGLRGDGISMTLEMEMNSQGGMMLEINPFSPLYEPSEVLVNGTNTKTGKTEIVLPAGTHRVTATYKNRSLKFSAEDWKTVELISDNRANFCMVSPVEAGFENGTATQMNWFLQQYDEENGVIGDLGLGNIYSSEMSIPVDYSGWKLVFMNDASKESSGVYVETQSRTVRIKGTHAGDTRRHLNIFLRLMDRKYPYAGKPYPLRKDLWARHQFFAGTATPKLSHNRPDREASWQTFLNNPKTRTFFDKFSDKHFLEKPLLEAELEPLYADNNMDFAGTYSFQWSPWIFEPTYACDYVYGFGRTITNATAPKAAAE